MNGTGPTGAERLLVVNADDFGQSAGVNRGIIEAHERGIVTSASLMVRWPAAAEAAAYARGRPELGVGLHVDLGEWVCREDRWVRLYEVVPADDAAAVAAEVDRQVAAFIEWMGRPPSHLDSHQHAHREEPARSALLAAADRLGVPLRHFHPGVRYCGDFYGQSGAGAPSPAGIGVDALVRLLTSLPPGVTELACHPGYAHDLDTMYRNEREQEVRTLCDPRVRRAVEEAGVVLVSFSSLSTRTA